MLHSWKILLVAAAILGLLSRASQAVPLASTSPTSTYYSSLDDDDDDSEVVEITDNFLERPGADADGDADVIDLSFYGSALFGAPDGAATAELVANYTPESSPVNPEELGAYLEGDILVPSGRALTKNGVTSQSSRWPHGVVPFEIRGHFSARDLATIESAMEQYHTRTCIRFVPRTTEPDYISIVSGNSGCWSSVGRIGGKQEVNLQSPGCLSKHGTAIHELMHALGFLHEQNRQERDSFVSIQYQNIQAHAVSNFEKAARTNAFGVPYDYGSVMHYSPNAFSTNGRPTIVAKQPGGEARMGQRDGFSAFDVEKLNQMYDCGYGGGSVGSVGVPAPVPVPAPAPAPAPAPVPAPAPSVPVAPAPSMPNNIVGSFISGLISGLGLGDEETAKPTAA